MLSPNLARRSIFFGSVNNKRRRRTVAADDGPRGARCGRPYDNRTVKRNDNNYTCCVIRILYCFITIIEYGQYRGFYAPGLIKKRYYSIFDLRLTGG